MQRFKEWLTCDLYKPFPNHIAISHYIFKFFCFSQKLEQTKHYIKGTVLRDRFRKCWRSWQILALTRPAAGFWIYQRYLWFLIPVNAKMAPTAYVIRLFLYLYSRKAFFTEVVSFYKQPIRGSVGLFKPIGAKLWPISEHRENCNSLSECYLHISKYHLAYRRPKTRFYGACRTYANFVYLILILRDSE